MADKKFKQYSLPKPPDAPFDPTVLDRFKYGSITNNPQTDEGRTRLGPNSKFERVIFAGQEIFVEPGGNIQEALNALGPDGGVVVLGEGTHTVDYDITPVSDTTIRAAVPGRSCIIDFNSNSNSIIVRGTDVYTTGTISSIGSSGFVVTGSGTSWSGTITTDHSLFIENRFYRIASVDSNTQITLSEPYKSAATYSGTYRLAKTVENVDINGVYIINSAQTALDIDDSNNIFITNPIFLGNNKALEVNNSYLIISQNISTNGSTSDGISITNASGCSFSNFISSLNGGHGIKLDNVTSSAFTSFFSTSNTTDGVNATSVSGTYFTLFECSLNGGQGIECVSGCNNNTFEGNFQGNTSDGLKLTATSDNNRMSGGYFFANGGYGINIAASTCDNSVIASNRFVSNTSGAVNDSGTGTLIRGNIGVSDNATSSQQIGALTETFTAAESISAGNAVRVTLPDYDVVDSSADTTDWNIDNVGSITRRGTRLSRLNDLTSLPDRA